MKEIRRRTRVVGCFSDGNSTLMLVVARLRHIAGTRWGIMQYLKMDRLEEQALEFNCSLNGEEDRPASIVRVFKPDGSLVLELRPYDNKYGYGVTVATTDLDEDGIEEIITGLGFSPQNQTWVKVFRTDGTEVANFLAYPENIGYGVRVSTGKTGE